MEHETLTNPQKTLKTILFTVFGVIFILVGLFFLESLFEGLLPWVTIGCPGCDISNPNYDVNQYRWFGATHGALVGFMFTGSLIALLWKPWEKPLLLQYYILGHIWFLVAGWLIMESNPDALPFIEVIFLAPLVILSLTYPGKGVLTNMFKQAEYHRPLLILTLIVLVFLTPIMWESLMLQMNSGDDAAQFNRWLGVFEMCSAIILASVLAATRKPGWKPLTILIGITFIYLGLAAITVPNNPGSWGILGGILSILGGIGYITCATYKKWNPTSQSESKD